MRCKEAAYSQNVEMLQLIDNVNDKVYNIIKSVSLENSKFCSCIQCKKFRKEVNYGECTNPNKNR